MTDTNFQTVQVNWRRAEFVLALLGILGCVTLLISVKTVWGGLPAHPLFIHVPVVLIPLSVIGALVCVGRPALFDRYGVLLCGLAVVAMSSTFLAMQAGGKLRAALHLHGQAAHLISEHSAAANVLAITFVLLTAILIITFASQRVSTGMPLGIEQLDKILKSPTVFIVLRVLLGALALLAAFYVYRVGDLGARAVWDGHLQAAAAVRPPR